MIWQLKIKKNQWLGDTFIFGKLYCHCEHDVKTNVKSVINSHVVSHFVFLPCLFSLSFLSPLFLPFFPPLPAPCFLIFALSSKNNILSISSQIFFGFRYLPFSKSVSPVFLFPLSLWASHCSRTFSSLKKLLN